MARDLAGPRFNRLSVAQEWRGGTNGNRNDWKKPVRAGS
jgi:hypothetical protein